MIETDEAFSPSVATAEEAVLGSCLLDVAAATYVLERLRPEHLADARLRKMLAAVQIVTSEGGIPDAVAVYNHLAADNQAGTPWGQVLRELVAAVPSAANHAYYVRCVLRNWLSRLRHEHAERIAANGLTAADINALRRKEFHAEEEVAKKTAPVHTGPPPFAPVGAFDLLNTSLPMIEDLVSPRILYRGGVTVLVASHKRGKSLAALGLCADLVVNIATPLEQRIGDQAPKWLGQEVSGAGCVLVYSAEGGPRMIQERIRKMIPNAGEWLNDLKVYAEKPTPQLDRLADLDAVFAHAETAGAVLLVFDPLGRFWTMEEEGDPQAARDLMEAIQLHAEKAYNGRGIAVLIIHHDTKASGADENSAVTGGRGSGKFGDDADALINLKIGGKDTPKGQSKVHFLLRHAESPAPLTVEINSETLRMRALSKDEVAVSSKPNGRPPKASLAALVALVRHKKRVLVSEIPDHLGISYGTWKNIRRDMLRELTETASFSVGVPEGETGVHALVLPEQPT